MDSFIKDMVFSIFDNDMIKSQKDLQKFLLKFIEVLENFEYESIDLTKTSDEEETDEEPSTSDEDFIVNSDEESSDSENLDENIFICNNCKEKCIE